MGTGFYGGRFSPSRRCVCISGVGGEEERGCRTRGQAPATGEPPGLAIPPRWTMHREKGVIQFSNALAVWIPRVIAIDISRVTACSGKNHIGENEVVTRWHRLHGYIGNRYGRADNLYQRSGGRPWRGFCCLNRAQGKVRNDQPTHPKRESHAAHREPLSVAPGTPP